MKAFLLLALLLVQMVLGQDGTLTATIQINNVNTPLWETSPDLYGLMYEEIGHQGAGGMHTELLSNGYMQQDNTIAPWTVQSVGGGSASDCSMKLDTTAPYVNNVLPRQLLVASNGNYPCGAVNTGFSNNIGAQVGVAFNISVYMRTTADAAEDLAVTIQLWDSKSNVIGSVDITGITEDWANFQAQIMPTITVATTPIKFVALVPAGEQVWFQGVSLIPNQFWRGLPYIRAELGDLLAAIKPATFRFPGGCFVEGDVMKDAYNWKTAIGPYIERQGVFNGVWGYWSPNLLGPFELLMFAEKMGMKPIWVINTGASHKEYVNDTALLQFIQDAVDAVEFAIGDATSTWGSKRAAMGHPEPFNPETFMIGIGNEEDFNNLNVGGLPLYTKSYPKFYNAIKSKFPNIKFIANNATVIVGGLDATDQIAELHDYNPAEHYINMREIMWQDWRPARYLYVSEYGASCSTGAKYCVAPWSAAISEAAFLLGMERSSNYVRMSCSETIGSEACFNSIGQTYGSPSYWTKYTLAVEQGKWVVDTQAYATSGWEMYASALAVTRENAATGGLEMVLKVVNWGNFTYQLTVEANGFPAGWQLGSVATSWITMNGTTPNAQNSFTNPNQVCARTQTNVALQTISAGTSFLASVPYASISILVIPLVKSAAAIPAPTPAPKMTRPVRKPHMVRNHH